jgi:hypothetical protein
MSPVVFEMEMPAGWESFRLPSAVDWRLQELLDRQDAGQRLLPTEREEAEGLVGLAEWLSLMRLRAHRIADNAV